MLSGRVRVCPSRRAARQRERTFVDGQGNVRQDIDRKQLFLRETPNCFTKPDRFVDVQQVMSVFVETGDALGGEPASEREDEIVVSEFTFDLPMCNHNGSFKWIDMRDFSFDEVDPPVQHRLPQIERDVGLSVFRKRASQAPDKRRNGDSGKRG